MKFLEDNLSMPISELVNQVQNQIINNTTYFGIKTFKNPFDFWIYQEIITEVQPDIIIEIGNFSGGSTLALAHILDNLGKVDAKVIGIDINHTPVSKKAKEHKKINFITGNAIERVDQVKNFIRKDDVVLVIEDSSHVYEDTLEMLKLYSPLVTKGSYFIVEDSIISNGLDIKYINHNGGPYKAINEFVENNHDFEIDRKREKYILTWNPKGFLKRIK